ncbi:TIGR02147 family protein [Fibrobacterota bacterium]
MEQPRNIMEFNDYRDYLSHYYRVMKHQNARFSYRYIAGKIGMDSSFLIRVMQKKTHLPANLVASLDKFLGLKKRESQYLKQLVLYNRSKTEAEAKTHLEALIALQKPTYQSVNPYQYDYYKTWYHSAVRLLLDYYPFDGDFEKLGKQLNPAISGYEAKKSVELLEKLNLIKKSPSGRYKVLDDNLTSGRHWTDVAVGQYQMEVLNLAKKSLQKTPKRQRNISTLTLNISQNDLPEIDRITSEYRRNLARYINSRTQMDSVYQINIQIFPLTQLKNH